MINYTEAPQKLSYASMLGALKRDLSAKKNLDRKVKTLSNNLAESQGELVDLLDAQKILATVSDDNTRATLDFVTGVVNKALAEVFPEDTRRIYLHNKLYAKSKPHVIVELQDGKGNQIDLSLQSGAGLCQIVSVLYCICLIEIRKGRRLVILDERLNGLHKKAKKILSEILSIFSEAGFQFIFVEYALNDLGKLYNVEKHGDVADILSLEGAEYNDEDVFLSTKDVDLSVLDKDYVEDENEE